MVPQGRASARGFEQCRARGAANRRPQVVRFQTRPREYASFQANGVNGHNFQDPYGFHHGSMMAMCDGSVHMISEDVPAQVLRALLTRDGSEIVDPSDW
jgi:hypothetical protein